ncbi:MAG: putative flagellar basal body rod protein [Deltaproteobacteria bacterium]|jgi:flagellar hook protein FlgE|nr:putative flagellar basal body rod protein [Deltaproteobacteria bacterium]
MISGLSASVSGLWVFVRKLENAARNIANSNTDGYKGKKATIIEDETGLPTVNITVDGSPGASFQDVDGVLRETSNVELSKEMTDLLIAKRGYEANLQSIKTQDDMLDSLLDITV